MRVPNFLESRFHIARVLQGPWLVHSEVGVENANLAAALM